MAHYQVAAVLSRIPYYVSQSVIAIIFPLIAGYAHNSTQANQTARQALKLVISCPNSTASPPPSGSAAASASTR